MLLFFLLLVLGIIVYVMVWGNSAAKRKREAGREVTKGTIDHRYNARKSLEQQEVDRILDKIHRSGLNSLTPEERSTLERYH
ncbi:hypothetical protein LX64_04113 [Chitinophaga skermanii]|uniref:DUF6576 domain-containing protein n=1 Tax=Chitinophaga skermanii TaxID=331697 RepID=A0A327Q9C3_9BACT|nr:DUF6576 domain-containing protein [Chitinophaga skermanii]RAJ00408.1 hypothetical protein LX64_04113 [Chitinophaga skermanii]